ncbi:MAG: hypothetical protein AAGJ34_00120 [Pseudomonadota bacterium]
MKRRPFNFESTDLERDCARLLQLLYASKVMRERIIESYDDASDQDKAAKDRNSGLLLYLFRGEEADANRTLMNLAIVVRSGFEAIPIDSESDRLCSLCYTFDGDDEELEALGYPNSPKHLFHALEKRGDKPELFGIRQTCNKIIHATNVEWQTARVKKGNALSDLKADEYIEPWLWLGSNWKLKTKQKKWACYVNVEAFCLNTLGLY